MCSKVIKFCYMFNCRLEPTYDAEERQLISDLFNGGAMRNLNPNSIIVSINDKYPIDVKCIQSFSSGQFLSEIAMDAFLELCNVRDLQLVTAFNEVNVDKSGYIPRIGCTYLNSQFSSLLMQSDFSVDRFTAHDLVQELIQKQTFRKSYRTFIPVLWTGDHRNEWLLIIMDTSNHTINFIFTKFSVVVESSVSEDEKAALTVSLRGKLEIILSQINLPPDQEEQKVEQQQQIEWTFVNYFNSSLEEQSADPHRRIPLSHYQGISEKAGSGIYIMHTIECEYFDAPLFAPLEHDWINIRRNLAYSIIKEQLMIS